MRRWILTSALALLSPVATAQTLPTTQPAGPALWTQMLAIDAKASAVRDLTANFTQQKFTPLLKKPLISSGSVKVVGSMMRWETQTPTPSTMVIDDQDVRIYYPGQKRVEVYKLTQQLAQLATSPLPRLEVTKQHFSFEKIPVTDIPGGSSETKQLALKLTPTDPALKEHVDQVRVLLDITTGFMIAAEIRDSDGDRTVLTFDSVKINSNLSAQSLRLDLPPGTTVSRPMAGMEGNGATPDQGETK